MVLPDIFIDQDKPEVMYAVAGLNAQQIVEKALGAMGMDAASVRQESA
jgi:1-deoxy-D-xylulose-5-phosphate synthase